MRILITGTAGFIGFHLAKRLLDEGNEVVGIDNFNDYYEVSLKEDRNKILEEYDNFKLYRLDISDLEDLKKVFEENEFDKVCNIAAQAGVRYSIENPYVYADANLVGFVNMINLTKENGIEQFVYASSSSVYGNGEKYPCSELDDVDHPISLYAASKRANELIAYTYNHLFGLRTIGLRFFTVYGPWGRPDMAIYKFAKKMMNDEEIPVFNYGKDLKRDFTYIDDIIDGVCLALESDYENEVFNLGKGSPDELGYMIDLIEKYMGIEAKKNLLPMQQGDVMITYSDTSKAKKMLGYSPKTTLDEGIEKFVEWFEGYYELKWNV
ncbi:MAG: NAD-dependent epimerase/dehydratase [candidate division WS6 bacterium 34_10]|uniref:NAD-dependent epimerase/dehydratase n=1 Tax=candidate division WS6 bacterium 34_10 TaxID=1641389 RepID=A0A101HJE0_9BACT|nr:MAG: NAD-dependent epimerase/dehydratase [candidate division WS6 bacterium 34_10]